MDFKRKRMRSLEVDLPGSGLGLVMGCFELDNDLSGPVMCIELTDQQLLEKDYAQYSWLV
jgi:hypothetical protein